MTYASNREYFDADSHIMELPDFLRQFADPAIRDALPSISYSASSVSEQEARDLLAQGGHSDEHKASLVALGDDMIKGPKEPSASRTAARRNRRRNAYA